MTKKPLLLLLALLPLMALAQHNYFGFTPQQVEPANLAAIGTGKSTTLDACICLNPTTDPVVARLKGHRILGVRLFVRADYKGSQQAANRYAFCMQGSLYDEAPLKTTCKFSEGWNEVMLPQAVTIGDEPLYLGARIYETFGTPYPFCNYIGAVSPDGYYIRAGKESPWTTRSTSGGLLIQAILEDDEALTAPDGPLSASAHVSFSDAPLTVNPDGLMQGHLYMHNQSASALQALTFATTDTEGVTHTYNLDLSEQPLEAYDGRTIDYRVYAPSQEGLTQTLTFSVLSVQTTDGQTLDATHRSVAYTGTYYVMHDAFVRIPVVEMFTSQRCVNCPMMIYYLDRAIEKWRNEGKPIVYATHHTGFVKDKFTQPTDGELLYLFGLSGDTFNPAVMYDRRVFQGDETPIHSAKVAEVSVYTECIEAVNNVAALAEVNIRMSDDGQQVIVSGKVNRNFAKEQIPVYLNCYLIEDGIPATNFPQEGLDTDGAPEDLVSTFRHNGVVRHCFTQSGIGDLVDIEVNEETATFTATYDYPTVLSPLPILDYTKTDIVAFLHVYDTRLLYNNYILNAGSLRYCGGTVPTALQPVSTPQPDEAIYDLCGRRLTSLPDKGIYIQGGRKVVRK